MVTFRTPEEADFAFIRRTELAEPPDCKVVLTLGTLYLDSGHSFNLIILIIHYHNLLFLAFSRVFHLVPVNNLPDIAAFTAFQLATRRN